MITKHHLPSGYSGRYRKAAMTVESEKAQSTDNSRVSESQVKEKLPVIDHRKFATVSPPRGLFKKNNLIKAIEEKSKDYENAIKDHLGIKNLSRDSSKSDFSPIPKPRITTRPNKIFKSMDSTNQEDLAAIEIQENKIATSIRSLDKKKIMPKLKNLQSISKNTDMEDKEIKLIQDSLNKINLLLSKLLKKNPIRHK